MENNNDDSDDSHAGTQLQDEGDSDSDDPPNIQLNRKDSRFDGILNTLSNAVSLKGILSRHSRKWTSKSSLQLLTMHSMLIFIATAVPNIQWPFIILFFQNQGSSVFAISFYASCMSIFVLITSLCSPKLKQYLPLKQLLILCLAILCLTTCCHGLIGYLTSPSASVVIASLIRVAQGVSSTMIQVLAVSILIKRFPDKSGRVSAVNESALGLGHSLAPLIGGIVYDKVGFLWTFLILGSVGLVAIVPVLAMPTRKFGSASSAALNGQDSSEDGVKWRDLLFLSPVAVCTVAVLCETCVEWVMALYINDMFGEDATLSGLVLSALSLSSILFAFMLGYICDRVNPFLMGVTGCGLCSLGYLLMVPPPGLGIPVSKPMILAAAILAGFGSSMIWLHIMPAMLFVKTKCRDKPVDGGLSNMVSLLYAVGISVGETGGSYIAGALETWCTYWEYFAILSATMALTTVFSAICYIFSRRSLCRARSSSTIRSSTPSSYDVVVLDITSP